MLKTQFLGFLFIACILSAPLKGQITDSIPSETPSPNFRQRLLNNKVYQISHIGAPLIIAGALTYRKDKAFQSMRNSYMPKFRSRYDDILQYTPGIVMLGLKSAGVEGRSSWGRMITSDAIATGIMAITVNSLKSTIVKERPDRSENNSFPSGHTATAFMLATMLHKEYGTTRSPLYSVLGYSLATGTAISRQLNNKHWFSDVLTGAGIGVVSTELGYYLADLIFKKKGLIRSPLQYQSDTNYDSYSFFGLQMGYNIGECEIHLPEDIELEGFGGTTASLTGAWFFNSHWGVGGKFTVSQTSPHVESDRFLQAHPGSETLIEGFEASSMSFTSLLAGLHYTTRIAPSLYVGGSVMGGVGWASDYKANIRYKQKEETVPLIHSVTRPIPNVDLNAYIMHVTEHNMGVKLFINYNTGMGKSNYTYYSPQANRNPIPMTGNSRVILHNLNIGAEINALFWK